MDESSESASCKRSTSADGSNALRRFGDYDLLEEIARGGMGIVYRARQVSLNRIVAVKVLAFGKFASDEMVERFRAEAKAAAALQHPHIVAIHEVGNLDGQHYFSMDYVPGPNLGEVVRRRLPSPNQAATYGSTIAAAVHFAHGRGILHRDLKPSNILIDEHDQARVTDFGLAKQMKADQDLTPVGHVLGSPNYMSPEQAEGKEVGPACDVYSIGAILYHLLTGRPPFVAGTLEELLMQVLTHEPVSPRLLNASVPADLDTICLKCLEKEPRRRYGDAGQVQAELDRFLRGESIEARPATRIERLLRWSHREPVVAALAATAALLVLVGGSLVLWQWRRAEHALTHAERQQTLATASAAEARQFRYASDMKSAFMYLRDGNLAQARQLLDAERPQEGELDLRGFEWRHLAWRCRGNYVSSLPKQAQVVGGMLFSPDSQRLATYAWNDVLVLWDVAAGSQFLRVTNAAALGAFSTDSSRFVFGDRAGQVQTLDIRTRRLTTLLQGAGELVASSVDRGLAVTVSKANRLQLWDLTEKRLKFTLPEEVRRRLDYGWAAGVALSPDGRMLALVRQSKAVAHTDPAIILWDVQQQAPLGQLVEHRRIRSLQFSPDGHTLAVGDNEGTIRLWNIPRLSVAREIQDLGGPVLCLAFSADGQSLATGGSNERIRLWDVANGSEKSSNFEGQVGGVWSLAFSPNAQYVASGSRETTVKIWRLNQAHSKEVAADLLSDEWGNFNFSSNGRLMAAGCRDNTVRVWNVRTLEVVTVLSNASYAAGFSKDNRYLLTASLDELPRLWNLETREKKTLPAYPKQMKGAVSCVDLSPDHSLAALGFDNGFIQLLEISSGREIKTFLAHSNGVSAIAFAPADRKLLSGGRDNTIAVWDMDTFLQLDSNSEHRGTVCTLAISHDGKIVASGCSANAIRICNPLNMRKSLRAIPYHQSIIRSLSFSPDGLTLASGSEDNSVKFWNTRTWQEVGSLVFSDHIRLVTFSPDGENLAVVTDSGKLHLLRGPALASQD